MNSDNYTYRLGAFNPLSPGLKAYIDTIAEKTDYKKGDTLFFNRDWNIFFPFITNGKLKVIANDKQKDEETFIDIYGANEFLYHTSKVSTQSNYELYAEFLEDSSIVGISEKHFSNVMKLFSEACLLNLIYTSIHFDRLIRLLAERTKTN